MAHLERFIKSQEDDYDTALKEIKNGKKTSCWMWYIFPQIKGLGMSYMANFYGIDDIEEAIEYLNHELLRNRLVEISNALLELKEDTDIHYVMGFPDDLKLKSSMTLFKKAEELSDIKCDNVFSKVLERYFDNQEDNKTLLILKKQKESKNKNNENNEDEKKEKNDNKENENSENKTEEKNNENKEDIVSKEKEQLNIPKSRMEESKKIKEENANKKDEFDEVQNNNQKCKCSDYCIII